MSERFFGRVDAGAVLADLRGAPVNYSPGEVRQPEWNFDTHRSRLPSEPAGAALPGGSWETACRLVERYEFSLPELVRAVYDPAEPLLGRTMLLQARFHGLHFYCGVRVTHVHDETRGQERVWGWAYETLAGHLERGRVSYEVVKDTDSGRVEFVVSSHSQASPRLGPVVRLGWRVFGRRTQLRFYRGCGKRLHELVETSAPGGPRLGAPPASDGLALAPSDASFMRLDRVAVHRVHPG